MSTVVLLGAVAAWPVRHLRYAVVVLALAALGRHVGSARLTTAAVAALVLPALTAGVWATLWPVSHERVIAGPCRRWRWRRWVRRCWPDLARECGLSVYRNGKRPGEHVWMYPALRRVSTCGDTLTLRVRARAGQTVEHLEAAAAAIGTAAGAVAWRTHPGAPGVLVIDLVMRETLHTPRVAAMPKAVVVVVDALPVGRRQDGTPWVLPIRGRHILVVGCSGSGKGSILWGIAAGLAPAVHADVARLWGVDLKRGVEIGMGAALFTTVATTPVQAVEVLRRLLAVIDARGSVMAGKSRLHEPTPVDPLHVLLIDELAALTAYADADTKREAIRLLSEVLTQGRALGVVVVGCVQDPRKDTVSMRGLFTQTVALRLRSVDETGMVLGDGTATLAPAHRVSPAAPGCGWLVEDDGTADRVRADHWPDQLVQAVAARYPAAHLEDTAAAATAQGHGSTNPPETQNAAGAPQDRPADAARPPARSGRKPRSPRASRRTTSSSSSTPSPRSSSSSSLASCSSSSSGAGWVA